MMSSFPRTPNFKAPQPRKLHYPSPALSNYYSDDDQSNSPIDPSPLSYIHQHQHSRSHLTQSPFNKVANPTFLLPASDTPSPVQMSLATRVQKISHQILTRDLDNHAKAIIESQLDELERNLNAPEVQSREEAESSASALFTNSESEGDDAQQAIAYEDMIAAHQEQIREHEQTEDQLREGIQNLEEYKKNYFDIKESYNKLQDEFHEKEEELRQKDHQLHLTLVENLDLINSLRQANRNLYALSQKFEELDMASEHIAREQEQSINNRHHAEASDQEEDASTVVRSDSDQDHESQAEAGSEPFDGSSSTLANPENEMDEHKLHTTIRDASTQTDKIMRPPNLPSTRREADEWVRISVTSPWRELWQGLSELAGGIREDND